MSKLFKYSSYFPSYPIRRHKNRKRGVAESIPVTAIYPIIDLVKRFLIITESPLNSEPDSDPVSDQK